MIEIPVLHHVQQEPVLGLGPNNDYSITPEQLEKYCRARVGYESGLQGKGDKKRFFLTFDDGYKNNLTEALPVLERYGYKAAIFITTGFIEGELYPYEDELAAVFENTELLRLPNQKEQVNVDNTTLKRECYRRLRLPLKTASLSKREAYMQTLAKINNYNRRDFQAIQFLSWDEVAELDRHPLITIGAHTHTHPVLTHRFPWDTYQEMKKSKDIIEEKLDHQVKYFSYPYGRNNFLVRFLAKLCGYKYAFTTENRLADMTEDNHLELPRVEIKDRLA
ncbi:MAG: polysaccharide deacetylase family protein [Bacteroidota bacterium]